MVNNSAVEQMRYRYSRHDSSVIVRRFRACLKTFISFERGGGRHGLEAIISFLLLAFSINSARREAVQCAAPHCVRAAAAAKNERGQLPEEQRSPEPHAAVVH